MKLSFAVRAVLLACGVAAVASLVSLGWAAERKSSSEPVPAEEVDLFSALEAGQISVRLIPKDSKQCTVMVENKTQKPLRVKLPSAFVGVPVLAQLDGRGGLGAGGGIGGYGRGGWGGAQAFGGGWGGGWGGMGGWGGGFGGGWNIPPERVATFKLPTVCLDYGKPEPRPQMTYEIKKIEDYTDNKVVHEVVRALAAGVVPQRIAQLAAWHAANGVTWQELASQTYRHVNGMRTPIYSPAEIQAAMQLVATVQQKLQEQKPSSGYQPVSTQ